MRPIQTILLLTAILINCSLLYAQKNALYNYFPADAKAVIHINLPSLASKMSWQEFKQIPFLQEAMNDAQEFLKKPAASGINFLSGLFIVMLPDADNKTKNKSALYGQLADTALFRTMLKKADPKMKIKTIGKIHVAASDKTSMAWTGDLFVMPLSKNTAKDLAVRAIKMTDQSLALLKPVTNPLANDNRFNSLINETGDIRFWINRNMDMQKVKKNKADDVLKMMNWGMMQNGNYMTGVVNFENGKAVAKMKTYMSPTMDSLYRLYPSKSLNTNLLKKLPAGQPLVLISFNMSTDLLAAIFKESGMKKMMDSVTAKSAVKPGDIAEGLNGDLSIAVVKPNEIDEKDSISQGLGIQIFIAASVKNKSKLEPLLAQLQKKKEPANDEEETSKKQGSPFGGMKPSLLLTDSFFVASISSFAAEKFLNTSAENEVSQFADSYSTHSSLFALDLKTILGFAMQMSKKKPAGDDETSAKLVETFDKLVFYGGQYQGGAALSAAEFQFSNKEENSLKQFAKLIEAAAAMGLKGKKASSYNDEEMAPAEEGTSEVKDDAETTELPPPPLPKPKAPAAKKKKQ
jgi:Domain of unknown function (DUF4836)